MHKILFIYLFAYLPKLPTYNLSIYIIFPKFYDYISYLTIPWSILLQMFIFFFIWLNVTLTK
jgi:hypothetical protein